MQRLPVAIVLGGDELVDLKALTDMLTPGITEREMAVLAEKVVRAQARRTPASVGEPIDVLVVERKGPRWIKVKDGCR